LCEEVPSFKEAIDKRHASVGEKLEADLEWRLQSRLPAHLLVVDQRSPANPDHERGHSRRAATVEMQTTRDDNPSHQRTRTMGLDLPRACDLRRMVPPLGPERQVPLREVRTLLPGEKAPQASLDRVSLDSRSFCPCSWRRFTNERNSPHEAAVRPAKAAWFENCCLVRAVPLVCESSPATWGRRSANPTTRRSRLACGAFLPEVRCELLAVALVARDLTEVPSVANHSPRGGLTPSCVCAGDLGYRHDRLHLDRCPLFCCGRVMVRVCRRSLINTRRCAGSRD